MLAQLPKTFILKDPAIWNVDLPVLVEHILENSPEQDLNQTFQALSVFTKMKLSPLYQLICLKVHS